MKPGDPIVNGLPTDPTLEEFKELFAYAVAPNGMLDMRAIRPEHTAYIMTSHFVELSNRIAAIEAEIMRGKELGFRMVEANKRLYYAESKEEADQAMRDMIALYEEQSS